MEKEAGVVLGPAVVGLHQRDGRFVAVLGLAAHQAQGLIDQDGDQVGLLALGLLVDLNAHIGQHLHAHLGYFAIHFDPAFANPLIGFAARGHSQLGHTLVQAHRAVGAVRRCVALADRHRRATAAARRGRGGRTAKDSWKL